MHTWFEPFLRLFIASVLGALIGFERDLHRRPAGLRTHLVVALASATFMVISQDFTPEGALSAGQQVKVDASRIAAQVVSGAGFIAGGAILRSGPTVHGLTTAAGMWLVTAIGLCAGAGMFAVASFVTALGLVALWGLRSLERNGELRETGQLKLEIAGTPTLAALRQRVEQANVRVVSQEYACRVESRTTEVSFLLEHGPHFDPDRLMDMLKRDPELRCVRLQQLEGT